MRLFLIKYRTKVLQCLLIKALIVGLHLFTFSSCRQVDKKPIKEKIGTGNLEVAVRSYRKIGSIERISPELDAIVPIEAEIEVLGEGMSWAEGPLWIPHKQWVLCSDVKENRIHRWSEKNGFEIYLEPSGFTGDNTDSRERGSNGLALDKAGRLVLCQHGNRQVVRMNAPLEDPKANFEIIADNFGGWLLNSPNDLVYDSHGNLFFTDPPYGLSEKMMEDPKKQLPFQGIYRLDQKGELSLLTDKISRPNGLAFSPDEKILYVSNTDSKKASWLAFEMLDNGTLGGMNEILNVTDLIGKEVGFPDGMKVDDQGNIFTAGPGGVWIFNAKHELIGKIKPGEWVSNCAFDEDYSTLYITADEYLLRVKLKN
ncbi:SMP-30/gluconolactonase/LRE family protein [Flagellimonas sp. 2504JD4-2]